MNEDFELTMTRITEIITDIDRLRDIAKDKPGFRPYAIEKAERLIRELESLNVVVDVLWEGEPRQEQLI